MATNFWSEWLSTLKPEFFLDEEQQVKTFVRGKIERGECPEEVKESVNRHGVEKWKKVFEVLWTKLYRHCDSWSLEKKRYLDKVNKIALAKALKEIEGRYTVDKKILLKMKQDIILKALQKKVTHLASAKATGKDIDVRDIDGVMKLVKVELGEYTDIQKVDNVDEEGEKAVLRLQEERRRELEKEANEE